MFCFLVRQFKVFQLQCDRVDERYSPFIERAFLISQHLRDLVNDVDVTGECPDSDLPGRLTRFQSLITALLTSTFYRQFIPDLTRDGALSRHHFTDLFLQTPVALNQPVTQLTQALFDQGGLVSPGFYQFYLVKMQLLYSTFLATDAKRLQQSHTYLDLSQFYYALQAMLRVLIRDTRLGRICARECIHSKLSDLHRDLELLIRDL